MPESNHNYGFYYLNEYYLAGFKLDRLQRYNRSEYFYFHHPQLIESSVQPLRSKFAPAFAWENKPPPTDYIMIAAMLKQPAKIAASLAINR